MRSGSDVVLCLAGKNSGEVFGRILGCVVVLLGVLERQMLMVEVLM